MFLTSAVSGAALAVLLAVATVHPAAAEGPPAYPSPDGAQAAAAYGPAPPSEPTEEASVLAPAIVEAPQSPPRTRWAGRVSVGAAYRWAFDESMVGGVLEGELGAQNPRINGGVRLRIEVGKMAVSLPYQVVCFGPFVWLPPLGQIVRVGFGLDAGALVISRRTMPGSTLWAILMGGQIRLTADLLRLGPSGALQAEGGLTIEALTAAPGPLTISTTLGIGYRP